MHRSLHRLALLAALVVAGCAAPSAPAAAPPRAAAPLYEVSRAVAEAGTPPALLHAQLTVRGLVPPKRETAAAVAHTEDRTIYRVPVGSSPVRGPATALVTIVEFSDFQCPFCFRAEDTMNALRDRYGDQIRFVWKHEPLFFHKRAEPSSELTLAARAQKGDAGFWAVHGLLMHQRGALSDDDLRQVAKNADLDVDRAMSEIAAHKYQAQIDEDMDLADDVGATGTPTFFINGRKLVGAQPIDRFAAIIDEQLVEARAAIARGVAPAKLYETLQQAAVAVQLEKVTVAAPTAQNPSRGPANAQVVIQMWSDFQCPFCKRVEPTLAELEAAFPGQIRIVWRNHPLPFHAHADIAAQAAMEAFAQQGAAGFWKMHDLLLQNQGGAGLERAAIEQYASSIGLDMNRFRAALDDRSHRAEIEADTKIAGDAGLGGTPAFVINGYKLSGAQPISKFKKIVRQALADAK